MKLDACIITSSRSVEAWSAAARLPRFNRDVYLERWKNTAFYVVGAKSASLLEELLSTELRPEGVRILGAGESGTAEKLAEYILRTVGDQTKRFLYLTGDKNRDTLPSKLSQSSSISLETVQVYATCEHPDLSSSIQKIGEELRRGQLTHNNLSYTCLRNSYRSRSGADRRPKHLHCLLRSIFFLLCTTIPQEAIPSPIYRPLTAFWIAP